MTSKKVTATTKAHVVGATTDRSQAEALSGANVVTLRVSLRHPHKFDDLPDGRGGFKEVVLPGRSSNLCGWRRDTRSVATPAPVNSSAWALSVVAPTT